MAHSLLVPISEDYGPAMRALNERQQIFVEAMIQQSATGTLNYTEAARIAGYYESPSTNTLRVTGHRLAHSDKIQAAMLEEGIRRFGAALPAATATIIQIMMDPTAKKGERIKAAEAIFNRAGMPVRTEHHVTTKRELSEEEKIEKAIKLAKTLGIDPKTILGNYAIRPVAVQQPSAQIVEDVEVVATTEGLEDLLGGA